MNKQTLVELLTEHADALNKSENVEPFDSAAWLAAHTRGAPPDGQLLWLLRLAEAIKRALVPVPTPRRFRAELKQSLSQKSPQTRDEDRPIHAFVLLGAAVIGLLLLLLHRLKLGGGRTRSQPMATGI